MGADRGGATTRPPFGSEPGEVHAHRLRPVLVAAALYLVASIVVWWEVWSGHPTSSTGCGCGDSSLFTWFLAWPAYAITHGANPFFSTRLFHPEGVNLLANTSQLAIGVTLVPVTWIFGPIASLNVALTLSPALSALAMFVLLRRWVHWQPAAFVGGLLYGFSPLALANIADAHLMIGMVPVPPLVVLCLDELLIRQRRRPVPVGIGLGLLITLQFFLSTEFLLMTVVAGVIGVVLIVGYALLRHPDAVRRHFRFAVVGLGAGVVTAGVLLAYPAWFAVAGPAHFTGTVWAGFDLRTGGTTLGHFFVPQSTAAARSSLGPFAFSLSARTGGYRGAILSPQYFGFGVLVVVAAGLVAWWRDLRLWLFGGVAVASVVLSLGAPRGSLSVWGILAGLPQFENVVPSRFVLITYLAVAVLLGLIVDHTHEWVCARLAVGQDGAAQGGSGSGAWYGALAGMAVAAVALVPVGLYVGQNLPIATQAVVAPSWFRKVAPRLPPHQVLLVFPAPFSTMQSGMSWQAQNRMRYSMVGGGGPGALFVQSPSQRPGAAVISATSFSFGQGLTITPEKVAAVRRALDSWGVTMVVIPDQPELPVYDQIPSVPFAAALIAAATGQQPTLQDHAWVWTGVDHAGPPAPITTSRFSLCTVGLATHGTTAVDRATRCVLAPTAATVPTASDPAMPTATSAAGP